MHVAKTPIGQCRPFPVKGGTAPDQCECRRLRVILGTHPAFRDAPARACFCLPSLGKRGPAAPCDSAHTPAERGRSGEILVLGAAYAPLARHREAQPKAMAVLRRARMAPPTAPKPTSISTETPGSGMGGEMIGDVVPVIEKEKSDTRLNRCCPIKICARLGVRLFQNDYDARSPMTMLSVSFRSGYH